ncbi:ribbon-helix-helix domain-containing protein [Salinirubellus salinus]|uniref:Ribbon-helix-helix domain-containing protein n=1 Tax=Salinirubellus salinus TaxID=1364945 RepID=A0A9E7U9X9_9EURY|nr:ribbon-helix-helix domain-containing protein [Salinirubellus salinus]UWM53462.1 ribbon-helix-helix domain-containing protein [Salinirubellus salinus]
MAEATTGANGDGEIVTVNFRVTQSFLDEIDSTRQGRGFNSRSEFIRYTLRNATEFPAFDRDELIALLQAEEDIREGRTVSADEAREQFGTDRDE